MVRSLVIAAALAGSSFVYADIPDFSTKTVELKGDDAKNLFNALAKAKEVRQENGSVVRSYKSKNESVVIRCESVRSRLVNSDSCVVTVREVDGE
jgi:hypothetical protein